MSWSKNLANFNQLSWADRRLLLEAICWLAVARLSLLLIPFRRIAPHLGQSMQESAASFPPETNQTAERIGWSVQAMARRTPWESACLAQAISAKGMLRRRNIPSTLYLGLAKDETQSLQAHAWVRCGAEVVTGKAEHERFSVISFFAERPQITKQNTNYEQTSSAAEIAGATIQTVLLAVLNPVGQAATIEQLRQLNESEWKALVQAASGQHVLTLFFARLQTAELQTAVPPQIWSQMQEKHQKITIQNLAMYRDLHFVSQKLQAENIPIILLKGAYLATAVYPHIGQRVMGDLDLLVPKEKLTQAAALLHELGWQEIRPFSLAAALAHQHHLPPFAKKGANFQIELHWNIVYPNRAYSISPEELWQRPVSIRFAGTEALAFPPHLQLLHLAIHAAYNHHFAFDLRSLCDIATLIAQQQTTFQWEQVLEKSTAWGWQRGIYLTLQLVQDFWPNTAVPSHILSQLKPKKMPKNLTELAKQQLLWGRGNNVEVTSNFSQLKSGKTVSEKIKFIVSFIIPPRSRLSWQYGVPLHSPRIWLYYPINLRNLITRNARRTWHLLRGTRRVTEAVSRRTQLDEWLTNKE